MDISIGKDIWIRRASYYSVDDKDLFEIDALLLPTFHFWDRLETQCLSECCGINAYSFWEEDIKLAIGDLDKTLLVESFLNTQSEILNRKETVVKSVKLNDVLDKSVFIELLNHILSTIQK